MRPLLALLGGLSLTLLAIAAGPALAAAEPPPNVLLVIADDQGYGDFGFMGNSLVQTLRLDRLAAEAGFSKRPASASVAFFWRL